MHLSHRDSAASQLSMAAASQKACAEQLWETEGHQYALGFRALVTSVLLASRVIWKPNNQSPDIGNPKPIRHPS